AVSTQLAQAACLRDLRRIARVDADGEDDELLPDGPRLPRQHAARAVQHEAAEGRAGVIDEVEEDRPLTVHELSERHSLSPRVAESEVERNAPIEVLVHADVLETGRHEVL